MAKLRKILVGILATLLIIDPGSVAQIVRGAEIVEVSVQEEETTEPIEVMVIEVEEESEGVNEDDVEDEEEIQLDDDEEVDEEEEMFEEETNPFLNMPSVLTVNPQGVTFSIGAIGDVRWAVYREWNVPVVAGDDTRWESTTGLNDGEVQINSTLNAVEIPEAVFDVLFDGVYLLRFQIVDSLSGEVMQDDLFFFEIEEVVEVTEPEATEPEATEPEEDEVCLDDESEEIDCFEEDGEEESTEPEVTEPEETESEEDRDLEEDEEICLDDEGEEIDCPEICLDEDGGAVDCPEVCLDEDGEEIPCMKLAALNADAWICDTGTSTPICRSPINQPNGDGLRIELHTAGNGANALRTATVRNTAFSGQTATGNPALSGINANFSSTVPFVIPGTVIQGENEFTVTAIGRRGNNNTGQGAFENITFNVMAAFGDIIFEFPDTLERIEDNAFQDTRVVTSVGLLDLSGLTRLTHIGNNAFRVSQNRSVPAMLNLAHEIVLPPNLEELGSYALAAPDAGSNLTPSRRGRFSGELIIPGTIRSIGRDPFNGTGFLSFPQPPLFFHPFNGLLAVAEDLGFNETREQYESVASAPTSSGSSLLEKATRWTDSEESEGTIRIDYGNVSPGLINADIIIVADFSLSMVRDSESSDMPTAPTVSGHTATVPRSIIQDEIIQRTVNAIFDANDTYDEFDIRVGVTTFGSVSGNNNRGTSSPQAAEPGVHYFHHLTRSRSAIMNTIRPQTSGGRTSFTAGLLDVIDMMDARSPQEQNRPVMVLFLADGDPNAGDGIEQANLLRARGVQIFPIAVFENIWESPGVFNEVGRSMSVLSHDGETVFDGRTAEELENIIRTIAEDHMQFLPETEVVDIIGNEFELLNMADINSQINYNATAGTVSFEVVNGQIIARWNLSGAPAGRVHSLNINVRLRDDYQEETGDFRTNEGLHVYRDSDDGIPFRDESGNINPNLEPEHGIEGDNNPILGRWHVYYRFESTTSWRNLPEEILALLPGMAMDEPVFRCETQVESDETSEEQSCENRYFSHRDGLFGNTMQTPANINLQPNDAGQIVVEVADGRWVFNGWDLDEQMIQSGSIDFTGAWTFYRTPGISAEIVGGNSDSFAPEKLPVNPEEIVIRPIIPGFGPDYEVKEVPDESIAWQIIDSNGQPVYGGNGGEWWIYQRDEEGNLILDSVTGLPNGTVVGAVNRDEEGHVVIPEEIINGLADDTYRLTFSVTDPKDSENMDFGEVGFIKRHPEMSVIIEGDRDVLGGSGLPVNPEYIVIEPKLGNLDSSRIPNDAIYWEVIDTYNNVIRMGDGSRWWTVDADGNEITDGPRGLVTRDANGNLVIPRDDLRLTGGGYTVTAVITDPDTRLTSRDTQSFIVREIRITGTAPGASVDSLHGVTNSRPVNPETLVIHPSITGVPTPEIPSEDITWNIGGEHGARFAGNGSRWWEVDENGVEILGTGGPLVRDAVTGDVIIPAYIVDQLASGEHVLNMELYYHQTGGATAANLPFIVRRPEAEIEGDRNINPSQITGFPNISTVEPHLVPHDAIYWNIEDESGNAVIGGNGNTWWLYEREPAYVLDSAGNPELDDEGNKILNPNAGNVVTDGDGHPIRVPNVGGTISRNMSDYEGNLTRGQFIIPSEVIDLLQVGNYTANITVTDPDTQLYETDDWSFIIREPGAEIIGNRDVNPSEIIGIPGNTDAGVNPADIKDEDISWRIVGTDERPYLVGDGSSWWTVNPATGERVDSEPSGVLVRDEVTGAFIIPQAVINELPEGDFVVYMTVRDEVTGLTETDDWPFTLLDPVIKLSQDGATDTFNPEDDGEGGLVGLPVNPEIITAVPGLPGVPDHEFPNNSVVWTIYDREGNPVLDNAGNPMGGTGKIVDVGDLKIPEGDYTIRFVVTDPETQRTGEAELDFILRNPNAEISGSRPFNPESITGTPAISGVNPAEIDDEDIEWTIKDASGNPVIGGNGSQWWKYVLDEEGNAIPDLNSGSNHPENTIDVTRNPQGQVVIPGEIVSLLPGGDYAIILVVTDADTDETADATWNFTMIAPEIIVKEPVNPGNNDIMITPGHPESNLAWEIRDETGNLVAGGNSESWWTYEEGEPTPGGIILRDDVTGAIVLPPELISSLPSEDYEIRTTENHPDYGDLGWDKGGFVILRPDFNVDTPLNPEEIGIVQGNPNTDLEWTVVGPNGPIAGGDGENWWLYEREPEFILDSNGNPMIGEDGELVRNPNAGNAVLDEKGNPVQIPGSGGHLTITPDGVIVLPPEIMEQLPDGGDYQLVIIETHPEHGEVRNDTEEIVVTRPDLDVDRTFNPDEMVVIPGHPDSELEWTIVDEFGPVMGGDREHWWTYVREPEFVLNPDGTPVIGEDGAPVKNPNAGQPVLDETGNPVKIPGGTLETDPETGGIKIPQVGLDELPAGDYTLVVVEKHPTLDLPNSGNVIRADENPFVITRPGANTDRPFNPDDIVVHPGHPDTNTTWEISNDSGTVIAGGDEDDWWLYELNPDGTNVTDGQGNPVRDPNSGGELVRDEFGNLIIPPEIIDNLPNGDYTLTVTEEHPDYGQIAREVDDFVITSSGSNTDRPFNPEEIAIRPGHPDTNTVWQIRDDNQNAIAGGGDDNSWWLYELDENGENVLDANGNPVKIPNSGGTVTRDENGNMIIPPELITSLPEGEYSLIVMETHPEYGILSRDEGEFIITRPGTQTENGSSHPSNPGGIQINPGHSDTQLTWEVRDESGHLIMGGDENNWWTYDPETGAQIPDSGGLLNRNPETGYIILPPSVINQLPAGDYNLVIKEYHEDYGYIYHEVDILTVRDPLIVPNCSQSSQMIQLSTDCAINPDDVYGTPSIPGLPDLELASDNVTWVLRDSAGNEIERGTGNRIPARFLRELAPDDYSAEFTVTDPETGRFASAEIDFTIRFPHVTIDIESETTTGDDALNPIRIVGTPTLPDSDVSWVIRDGNGNVITSGVGTIIGEAILGVLPAGRFEVEFTENDPETGLSHVNNAFFVITNNRRPGIEIEVDEEGNVTIVAPVDCTYAPDGNGNLVITCPEGSDPTLSLPSGWLIIDRGVDDEGNVIIIVRPPWGSEIGVDRDGNVIVRPAPEVRPITPEVRPIFPGGGSDGSGGWNHREPNPENNPVRDIVVEVESEEMRITPVRPNLPQTGTQIFMPILGGTAFTSFGITAALVKRYFKK